jgi:hypothetical protein
LEPTAEVEVLEITETVVLKTIPTEGVEKEREETAVEFRDWSLGTLLSPRAHLRIEDFKLTSIC